MVLVVLVVFGGWLGSVDAGFWWLVLDWWLFGDQRWCFGLGGIYGAA